PPVGSVLRRTPVFPTRHTDAKECLGQGRKAVKWHTTSIHPDVPARNRRPLERPRRGQGRVTSARGRSVGGFSRVGCQGRREGSSPGAGGSPPARGRGPRQGARRRPCRRTAGRGLAPGRGPPPRAP